MTTAVFLAPLSVAGGPFFIPGGVSPASGGQLFTYITGTSTKLNTYTTSSGAVANSNPIVLDSGGFVTGSGEVWLIQSSSYRFILAPSTDTDPPASPYWTRDSISGINDVQTQINSAGQEWIAASTTPVFSNASSFSLGGDQRSIFTPGRRVKTINTGGTVYGTVTSAVFTSSTSIFVLNDSGNIDSGISAVSYGILSGGPSDSIPWLNNVTSTGLNFSKASVTTGIFTATSYAVWGTGIANFGVVVKRKTSDQSCTTSFVNDTDLSLSIAASEEWVGEYLLDALDNGLSSTAALKIAVTVPSGASLKLQGMATSFNPATSSTESFVSRTETSGSGLSFQPTGGSSGGVTFGVKGKVWVLNSTTAGSVNLQLAQSSAGATAVTVKRGSAMTFTRVA